MIARSNYTIKILQCNAQGISTSMEDLFKLISEHEPCIIAKQGTFLARDVEVNPRGFNCYCKKSSFNRRYHGGIATYLHQYQHRKLMLCLSIR